MNTTRETDEKALAKKLEELLSGVNWLHDWRVQTVGGGAKDPGFDLLATIPLPKGGKAALCVECKKHLSPSVFQMLAGRVYTPAGRPDVVVRAVAAPWISPRVAELCAEHGWSWFDLAGNYHLDVPGVLQIRHTGNAPAHKPPRPKANLGTAEAGRVIRALLLPEHAGMRWTQRAMQTHCLPISLGLVNKVVQHLREEAFVEVGEDGGFSLRDPLKLLFTWREAYRFDRHERRNYFTLLTGKKLKDALSKLDAHSGGCAAYAAFSAADYLAPNVRQPKTWLFVSAREIAKFEQLTEAKQVDSGENLAALIPYDDGVFYQSDCDAQDGMRLPCTNSVQTYVDLCHCGGRGEEAAEALLNQRIKPDWKKHGLNT